MTFDIGAGRRPLVFAVGLIVLSVFATLALSAERAQARVSAKIITGSQAALLAKGGLVVQLKSDARRSASVSARYRNSGKFFRAKKVRLKAKGGTRVLLKLTGVGRVALSKCVKPMLSVRVSFRENGRKHTLSSKRRLSRDRANCDSDGPAIPAP